MPELLVDAVAGKVKRWDGLTGDHCKLLQMEFRICLRSDKGGVNQSEPAGH